MVIPAHTSKADLHCHSTASQVAKLGVQRSLGLPECATPPEEVYELAKRRGMDFVTITDHDTIAGALEIAHRPDSFLSEELTAWFRNEPQAVHVLCYGISEGDHEWLQAHARDLEVCADYLHGNGITCALAHPFYAVEAPLTPRHRRRLAELFPIWETRNGSRARELNMPAAVYIETHGGIGIGGSDDHAGVDIGRTWTETPRASTPAEFLDLVRSGLAEAHGDQGSAAKWAHAAMALATRALGRGEGGPADPRAVMAILRRVISEGDVRTGAARGDLQPEHARDLLRAWLESIEFEGSEHDLLASLASDGFQHRDLHRRAMRAHERKLLASAGRMPGLEGGGVRGFAEAAASLFDACMPALPYAPATAFLAAEKAKLSSREGDAPRIALVADGLGSTHGVTRTLSQIRDRGVPGFEVDVIGTDAGVDRRLATVADVEVPFYPGLEVGIPTVPSVVETLAEGRYDAVHLVSPGPSGLAAALAAQMIGLPTVGSYHTELAAYAGLRAGDVHVRDAAQALLRAFYGSCDVLLSPSPAADWSLRELGIGEERIDRWDRGVDLAVFGRARAVKGLLPGELNVLYAGRQTREKGVDLLAEAFLLAHERDPRLHLVLAGGGPEEHVLRERLGEHATFLGWLDGDELARAYASADLFLFASRTDTFGQVILEAQASGLPVVAVAEGGPTALISHSRTGLLCPADPEALAASVLELAAKPALRERMAAAALDSVRARTWEGAMRRLADAYRRALSVNAGAGARRAA